MIRYEPNCLKAHKSSYEATMKASFLANKRVFDVTNSVGEVQRSLLLSGKKQAHRLP